MHSIQTLGESMPGGFYVYSAGGDGELLYANDVVLEIYGCKTLEEFKELTGFTFSGMVHPEDRKTVLKTIQDQVRSDKNKLDYAEYRIIRKDGSVRWVDDYGRLVRTQEYGEVYYVLIRDITDIHAAREENEHRAKVIEGLSGDHTGIFLLNLDTGKMKTYRIGDQQMKNAWEKARTEDTTRADWNCFFREYGKGQVIKEDQPRFLEEVSEEKIREHLASARSHSFTYRRQTAGEQIVYMELSFLRVEGETELKHVVAGCRDISEQVLQVQHELADKLNMEMELQREKHTNEIKSSFLFNMSHDIRTPMNAIKGFTDLALRHTQEPEKVREYLEKVDESNTHLLALIDDLLEMNRIASGKVKLRKEVCDLEKELDVVCHMFQIRAEEKQLDFEKQCDISDKEVVFDPLSFKRVMVNLLDNAVKFTKTGGRVKISVTQKQVSESGYARFLFAVSDTGVGMTEEFMQHMFEAFEREENSTQTGYIGTGLGLSITKKLLDMMGGSIAVESQKDKGTTVTVSLPLKLAEHTDKKLPEVPEESPVAETKEKHRILLVEDIEINRLLAENILVEAGFLVESVPDGSDAVEILRKNPVWYYDLILMDIQMPVMNGYEATRSIRAMDREDAKLLPIIALSANAREEDRQMSMESGMNSHVAKPFDIAHLIATVNQYIKNNSKE